MTQEPRRQYGVLLTYARRRGHRVADVLPDWWRDECFDDPDLWLDVALRVARAFRVSLGDLVALVDPVALAVESPEPAALTDAEWSQWRERWADVDRREAANLANGHDRSCARWLAEPPRGGRECGCGRSKEVKHG